MSFSTPDQRVDIDYTGGHVNRRARVLQHNTKADVARYAAQLERSYDEQEEDLREALDTCYKAYSALLEAGVHLNQGLLPLLVAIRNQGVDLPGPIQVSLRGAIAKIHEDSEEIDAAYQATNDVLKKHNAGPHRPQEEIEALFAEYDNRNSGGNQ